MGHNLKQLIMLIHTAGVKLIMIVIQILLIEKDQKEITEIIEIIEIITIDIVIIDKELIVLTQLMKNIL